MPFVKLQIGCLVVILYIGITYIREIIKGKLPYDGAFLALLVVAPWAVFFDGFTSWTVNHMDVVPSAINRGAHLLFLVFMELTVIITAEYMFNRLIGFHKNKKRRFLLRLPGLISLVVMTAGIGRLYYIHGVTTWYSMGFPVYVGYGTFVLYYGLILYFVLTRFRLLPEEKVLAVLACVAIAGTILVIQICYPEVLLTAIFPTILLLGIYIGFENPFILKLTLHNEEMLDGFATLVDSRDNSAGGHVKRTRAYVELILDRMRDDERYKEIMNRDYMTNVANAAPLHDIGKIATPDYILQKAGKLTPEEYEIMKGHAAAGGEIILHTFYNLDDKEFRQIAYEIARYHHEKYNGKGYPDGLAGEQIPIHARIMAIADVFDAVSQKRCYRDAMSLEESFSIIEKGMKTDFDPYLARLFLDSKEDVTDLLEKFREQEKNAVSWQKTAQTMCNIHENRF